jgi:glycosyltransferase involved in cell wall biosynthesis
MKEQTGNNLSAAPEISVIIPFHGDKKELINCMNGLQNQDSTTTFETILVESGKESVAKEIMNLLNNIVLISCKSVMYPGKARNLGIEASKSDFLAFIDADCVPSKYWIKEIHKSLKEGNEIVIGPITNVYPFHPIASVDNLLQFPDFQRHRKSKNITHFPACNLGITKELALNSNKFPEEVVTGEDVKFSQAAISNNEGKVFFNQKAVVRHSGRKSFKSFMKHNQSLGFHRGYLNLKMPGVRNNFRGKFLFAFLFGIRRFFYISFRTLQWNPAGLFRIVLFFPFAILGLSAWVFGFWEGNKKYLEEILEP